MADKSGTAMAPKEGFGGFISRDPFFRGVERNMRRLFGEGFGRFLEPFDEENWSLTTWSPFCDIYETDNEIVVKAELPEVKKENIIVSLENNVLMIRGERSLRKRQRRKIIIASSAATAISSGALRCLYSLIRTRSMQSTRTGYCE